MQQRPQTIWLQLGLVLDQDAAIHPEKVQTYLKGTTQKSGRKFRLNQQDVQPIGLQKSMKPAFDPAVSIDHLQRRREARQRADDDLAALLRYFQLRRVGIPMQLGRSNSNCAVSAAASQLPGLKYPPLLQPAILAVPAVQPSLVNMTLSTPRLTVVSICIRKVPSLS